MRFKGDEEKLNGHACQCSVEPGRKANQFNKPTEAIAHLANKTLPNPSLFKTIFTELHEAPIEEADDFTVGTKLAAAKWEISLKRMRNVLMQLRK